MRLKAILAEAARKRYPLSVMIIIIGVLIIPFPYLFIRYGLDLTGPWWVALGAAIGIVTGSVLIGIGSLVEDVHDISMHTVGYDLELGEELEIEYEEDGVEADEAADEDASEAK